MGIRDRRRTGSPLNAAGIDGRQARHVPTARSDGAFCPEDVPDPSAIPRRAVAHPHLAQRAADNPAGTP
ncbi:hypothetical protein ABK046_07600 [Streptomyces caeruleatus]